LAVPKYQLIAAAHEARRTTPEQNPHRCFVDEDTMRTRFVVPMLGTFLLALPAGAQSPSPAPSSAAQQSLAATLNVYVFPSGGQSASQQSKDEGACYQWAVSNTGSDAFEVQKQEAAAQQQAQQKEQQIAEAGKGAGAKGAVRGARPER
jgi:hypothetical protein